MDRGKGDTGERDWDPSIFFLSLGFPILLIKMEGYDSLSIDLQGHWPTQVHADTEELLILWATTETERRHQVRLRLHCHSLDLHGAASDHSSQSVPTTSMR